MKMIRLISTTTILLIASLTIHAQKATIKRFVLNCASIDYTNGVKVINDVRSYKQALSYSKITLKDCITDLPSISGGKSFLVFFKVNCEEEYHVKYLDLAVEQDDANKVIYLTQKYQILPGKVVSSSCFKRGCKVKHGPTFKERGSMKNLIVMKPYLSYKVIAYLQKVY